jgi:hypothetical protein
MSCSLAQHGAQVDRAPAASLAWPASIFDSSRMSLISAQQVVAGAVDDAQVALLLVEHAGRLAHDLREADDGVERRAQLVAHVGQENALGAVGRFGVAHRDRQCAAVRSLTWSSRWSRWRSSSCLGALALADVDVAGPQHAAA